MRVVLLALGLAGALTGAAIAQTLFSPTQDPLAGSRVFGGRGCVKCHAVNGVGGKAGPDLARVERPRSFFDLAAALWNHAPRMADRMRKAGIERPQLDAREMGDLAAFLFTLNYFDSRGNIDHGARLFTEKRCVVCHQVGGTGGVIGPNLDALSQYASPIYLAAQMWNHGPQMAAVMKARNIPRPTFEQSELRDLIAYIAASSPVIAQGPLYVLPGRSAEGRVLFTQKRCAECHRVGGKGGTLGPDLVERSSDLSLTQFASAMWNKTPAMVSAMQRLSMPVPQLTPEEMADIVAYLYSVRYFAQGGDPRKGLAVATAKGCLGCHPSDGERGKSAPELRKSARIDSPAGVLAALWGHSFIQDPRPERMKAAWREIRPDEMADLVAYLQSLRRPQ